MKGKTDGSRHDYFRTVVFAAAFYFTGVHTAGVLIEGTKSIVTFPKAVTEESDRKNNFIEDTMRAVGRGLGYGISAGTVNWVLTPLLFAIAFIGGSSKKSPPESKD